MQMYRAQIFCLDGTQRQGALKPDLGGALHGDFLCVAVCCSVLQRDAH